MKTVDEILGEMRKPKSNCPKDERYEVAYSVADLESILKNFADLIEAAVKTLEANRDNWRRQALDEGARANATCKDSLQVGDMAAMREALEQVAYIVRMFDDIDNVRSRVKQVMTAVLTTPPRNCDKCLTPKDAMLAHLEEVYEGEKVEFGDYEWCEFVKWLFAEAKGEAK